MKKIIAVLMSLIIICGLFPLGAAADEPITGADGFSYKLWNGETFVSGYDEQYGSEVVIPKTYDGKPVVGIWNLAFENCNSITSVTIPDNVTEIGSRAFADCTSLKSISLPDKRLYIAFDAFDGTAYYNDSSNWENDIFYVENNCVQGKKTLSGECRIREGTKTVGGEAFKNCDLIESLYIPESMEYIYYEAFSACSRLKDIVLSDSLIEIDRSAFNETAY